MREGCEIHGADLRDLAQAREATAGCQRVIHLGVRGGAGPLRHSPHTLAELDAALTAATLRAALDHAVERFVFVSSPRVFERAQEFPTPEEHLAECPAPRSAYGRAKLAGEGLCRAAGDEHGLPFTICRPFDPYGQPPRHLDQPFSGELVADVVAQTLAGRQPIVVRGSAGDTRAPTHVDDLAAGIVAAMISPAVAGDDVNLGAGEELRAAAIAELAWAASGRDGRALELREEPDPVLDVARRLPSVEKAKRLLGWTAETRFAEGIGRLEAAVEGAPA
jgi:nucleoside-diphosphate-sugar epimerase